MSSTACKTFKSNDVWKLQDSGRRYSSQSFDARKSFPFKQERNLELIPCGEKLLTKSTEKRPNKLFNEDETDLVSSLAHGR